MGRALAGKSADLSSHPKDPSKRPGGRRQALAPQPLQASSFIFFLLVALILSASCASLFLRNAFREECCRQSFRVCWFGVFFVLFCVVDYLGISCHAPNPTHLSVLPNLPFIL